MSNYKIKKPATCLVVHSDGGEVPMCCAVSESDIQERGEEYLQYELVEGYHFEECCGGGLPGCKLGVDKDGDENLLLKQVLISAGLAFKQQRLVDFANKMVIVRKLAERGRK